MNFFLTLATHIRVSLLSRYISFGLGQSLSQVTNLLTFLISKAFNLTETMYVCDYNFYYATHFAYNTHDRGIRHDNLLIKTIRT